MDKKDMRYVSWKEWGDLHREIEELKEENEDLKREASRQTMSINALMKERDEWKQEAVKWQSSYEEAVQIYKLKDLLRENVEKGMKENEELKKENEELKLSTEMWKENFEETYKLKEWVYKGAKKLEKENEELKLEVECLKTNRDRLSQQD